MPIEPETQLAFSIYENPSVYALLLGSGLSRSASIPTGWEITLDLIQRLAILQGEEDVDDLAKWYVDTFAKEASYSNILSDLASTPSERRAILHRYIEPTEQEREDGVKVPTQGHRAIARLVMLGFIRLIITTNFDRLIENALKDVGVEPTVVSSDDMLKGAVPLIHSKCFVVKVHGDYLDTRTKNSELELQALSRGIEKFLVSNLDDHGLIVCGWSGDWDMGLRNVITRIPSRRYPTYWAVRSKPSQIASDLIQHRRARLLEIEDADTFFTQLLSKIEAQSEEGRRNPESIDLLLNTVKRLLSSEKGLIPLRDLLAEEFRKIEAAMSEEWCKPDGSFSSEEFRSRLNKYASLAEPLARTGGLLARLGNDEHFGVMDEILKAMSPRETLGGLVIWINMRMLPLSFVFYSFGIALLAANKFGHLYRLLAGKFFDRSGNETDFARANYSSWILDGPDAFKNIQGYEKRKTASSDYYLTLIEEWSQDYLISQNSAVRTFELFEMLIGIFIVSSEKSKSDLQRALDESNGRGYIYFPIGRAAWDYGVSQRIVDELETGSLRKPVLAAGFCDGNGDKLDLCLKNIRVQIARNSW